MTWKPGCCGAGAHRSRAFAWSWNRLFNLDFSTALYKVRGLWGNVLRVGASAEWIKIAPSRRRPKGDRLHNTGNPSSLGKGLQNWLLIWFLEGSYGFYILTDPDRMDIFVMFYHWINAPKQIFKRNNFYHLTNQCLFSRIFQLNTVKFKTYSRSDPNVLYGTGYDKNIIRITDAYPNFHGSRR